MGYDAVCGLQRGIHCNEDGSNKFLRKHVTTYKSTQRHYSRRPASVAPPAPEPHISYSKN
jgi:hypothetical protein